MDSYPERKIVHMLFVSSGGVIDYYQLLNLILMSYDYWLVTTLPLTQ